eukprot:5466749-Pyramimonas_sp.AAC.1
MVALTIIIGMVVTGVAVEVGVLLLPGVAVVVAVVVVAVVVLVVVVMVEAVALVVAMVAKLVVDVVEISRRSRGSSTRNNTT